MTHLLDSTMIYIHPPFSIIGYAFVLLSLTLILVERKDSKHLLSAKNCLYIAWFFTLMGLLTGMLWAHLAWGSYWSWDPKETLTLLLFLCIGLSAVLYERQKKASFILIILSLICIMINLGITIGDVSLHSYNL